MENIYQDIPRIYTAVAEWLACMVYITILPKRFPKNKTIVIAAGMLIVQVVFMALTGDVPTYLWLVCMLVAAGLMYFTLFSTTRISFVAAGYCCARAFLMAEFTASLEWQIDTYFVAAGIYDSIIVHLFLFILIYGAAFVGAIYLEKPLLVEDYLKQISKNELTSAVVIVTAAFAFSNLSFIYSNSPFTTSLRADIFNIRTLVDLGGIAILYAFQSRICEYVAEKEIVSIQTMLKTQYDQYRNYQDSIEMVNIKYHDLKHQIAALRAETDVEKRQEWLDAMEHELDLYDSVDKTGNQVLDTIFAGKIIQCKKNNITITCVADGTLLNFIHVTDLCTIFGNALDNAIESVVLLDDPQKRLIHVSVSAQHQFVFIRIENYCESKLKLDSDHEVITTKKDKKSHGFGIKSIRYSVEKYDGSVSFDVKKNWFELRILIPVPLEEK